MILPVSCDFGKWYLSRIFNKQARPWEHACSWGPTWPSSSRAASRTLAWVGCHLWRAWFRFPSWPSAAHVFPWWKITGPITGLEIQVLWRVQAHHNCEGSCSNHPSQPLQFWKWEVCWKTRSTTPLDNKAGATCRKSCANLCNYGLGEEERLEPLAGS